MPTPFTSAGDKYSWILRIDWFKLLILASSFWLILFARREKKTQRKHTATVPKPPRIAPRLIPILRITWDWDEVGELEVRTVKLFRVKIVEVLGFKSEKELEVENEKAFEAEGEEGLEVESEEGFEVESEGGLESGERLEVESKEETEIVFRSHGGGALNVILVGLEQLLSPSFDSQQAHKPVAWSNMISLKDASAMEEENVSTWNGFLWISKTYYIIDCILDRNTACLYNLLCKIRLDSVLLDQELNKSNPSRSDPVRYNKTEHQTVVDCHRVENYATNIHSILHLIDTNTQHYKAWMWRK